MELPTDIPRWNPAMAEAFQKGMAARQNGQSITDCPYSAMAAFTANRERWRSYSNAWRDGWQWAAQQSAAKEQSMNTDNLRGKSVDELKAEIKELEKSVKELNQSIKDREDAIVVLIAEFQVGDRVVMTNYRGKESVYVITERSAGFALDRVRYWGKLIKKDGSLGVLKTDLSYHQLRKA
ncbi:MAG: hypothetical protein M1492_01710 [Gammaproteobacteria bacterium]|jgi:2-hydroxy-3-keto-5-methylthiopentenyl-1-phosphate phosphatase|nr:hypothetical protein [Gammaproteobacteria bacterium]